VGNWIGCGRLSKVLFVIFTTYSLFKMHTIGMGTPFFPTHIFSYLQICPEAVVQRQKNNHGLSFDLGKAEADHQYMLQ
jgi:hypothetical protein